MKLFVIVILCCAVVVVQTDSNPNDYDEFDRSGNSDDSGEEPHRIRLLRIVRENEDISRNRSIKDRWKDFKERREVLGNKTKDVRERAEDIRKGTSLAKKAKFVVRAWLGVRQRVVKMVMTMEEPMTYETLEQSKVVLVCPGTIAYDLSVVKFFNGSKQLSSRNQRRVSRNWLKKYIIDPVLVQDSNGYTCRIDGNYSGRAVLKVHPFKESMLDGLNYWAIISVMPVVLVVSWVIVQCCCWDDVRDELPEPTRKKSPIYSLFESAQTNVAQSRSNQKPATTAKGQQQSTSTSQQAVREAKPVSKKATDKKEKMKTPPKQIAQKAAAKRTETPKEKTKPTTKLSPQKVKPATKRRDTDESDPSQGQLKREGKRQAEERR